MIDITFIVGLPGSGKSILASSLPGIVIDDFNEALREDRDIPSMLRSEPYLIITDVNACAYDGETVARKLGEMFGEVSVTFIAFENDPDACWANIARRADERPISRAYLGELSRTYDPTRFSRTPRPVWTN